LTISRASRCTPGDVWQLTDGGAQPFGREFGYTSGASGFRGWVEHWFDRYNWWDMHPSEGVRE